jgi:hypothetical protein
MPPSALDLFAMKTVLIVLLFTLHPALCVVQPDPAKGLDSRLPHAFLVRQKDRQLHS